MSASAAVDETLLRKVISAILEEPRCLMNMDSLSAFLSSDMVGAMSEAKWPTKFATKFRNAKTAKTRAKITAARIEYFIQTGK